jgi:hypothetical protein
MADQPSEKSAALLAQLARAMHEAVTTQYEGINAELEARRTAQVRAIAARTAAEIAELEAATEADVAAIDAWAAAEAETIELERRRRIDARNERLAGELDRREAVRDRQSAAVEAATDAHRAEIDQFFGRLEREGDPAAIARAAADLPPLPDLDQIVEEARRAADAEPAGVDADAVPAAAAIAAVPTPISAPTPAATIEEVTPMRLRAVMDPEAIARRSGHGESVREWELEPYAVMVAAGPQPIERPDPNDALPRPRSGKRLLQAIPAARPALAGRETGDRSRPG